MSIQCSVAFLNGANKKNNNRKMVMRDIERKLKIARAARALWLVGVVFSLKLNSVHIHD